MKIEQLIQHQITAAFKELYQAEVEAASVKLEPTKKEFRGDLTFVVFPFLKTSRKKPETTASEIGAYLQETMKEIAEYNVINGFLNLLVADSYWLGYLNGITGAFPEALPPTGQKIMVEYSSPNTNKPLHLGHIRNNLLGYSVSEILKMNGHEVVKANLVNDRGIHICKSMLAWQKFGNGETPESSGMKGDHLVGKYYVEFDKAFRKQVQKLTEEGMEKEEAEKKAPLILEAQEMLRKWEAGDAETRNLWETMNGWVYSGFEKTYSRMGVDFDKYYYESDTYLLGKEIVDEGLQKNVFFKKADGSVWVDLTSDGLDEKLLLRGDGTSVYITQDIGTAQLKFDDFGCDKSIYVVGNEQDYHFKVLKLILQKLQKPYSDGVFHLSYGMVDLPSGRMKSREGTVVDADDLMDEMYQTAKNVTNELGKTEGLEADELELLYETIGLGALKFFLLKVDPTKRMVFNPEESIDFHGNTGPFIQYSYARVRSLMKNARSMGMEISNLPAECHEFEKDMIIHFSRFYDVLDEAARTFSPSLITSYVFDLARLYNRMYHELPVIKEQDQEKRSLRMKLTEVTGDVIFSCLSLLGIRAPERM